MNEFPVSHYIRARLFFVAVLACTLLACAVLVRADVRTVGPGGKIAQTAALLKPGDTLQVTGTLPGGKAIKYLNGTAAAPITIRAVTPGTAIISGSATDRPDTLLLDHCKWIVIDGIMFQDGKRHGVATTACEHVTVRNCVAQNNGMTGIFLGGCSWPVVEANRCLSNGEHGVYVSAREVMPVVRNNYCEANAGCGVQLNGGMYFVQGALVEGNEVVRCNRNGGAGINVLHAAGYVASDGTVTHTIIRANNVHDCPKNGIAVANGSGSDTDPIVVQLNTITFTFGTGGQCIIAAGNSTATATANICTVGRKIEALQAYDSSTLVEEGNVVSMAPKPVESGGTS